MTVPMKRRTSSARNRRRSHLALKEMKLSVCQKCGKAVRPHSVCSFCGSYDGREVIKIKTKKKKEKQA